jgi:hypothetical protein
MSTLGHSRRFTQLQSTAYRYYIHSLQSVCSSLYKHWVLLAYLPSSPRVPASHGGRSPSWVHELSLLQSPSKSLLMAASLTSSWDIHCIHFILLELSPLLTNYYLSCPQPSSQSQVKVSNFCQSQSHITTDNQSARRPSGTRNQFLFLLGIFF